jgi:2-haloacid dehalogenase
MAERWTTYDCYGTLIDWNRGIGDVLARLFGEEHRERLLLRYHEVEPRIQSDGYRLYRDVLDLATAEIAREEGRELSAEERTAMSQSLQDWPAFSDVPHGLAELRRRGWRIGILSNCDRDLIASSLPRLGVAVDEVVVAQDVRSYKPGHAHWTEFARRTGVDEENHVHVAQSLFHDIAPATELGLRSVWINRLGERPGPEPTRELRDLEALADTVDELVPA